MEGKPLELRALRRQIMAEIAATISFADQGLFSCQSLSAEFAADELDAVIPLGLLYAQEMVRARSPECRIDVPSSGALFFHISQCWSAFDDLGGCRVRVLVSFLQVVTW